MAFTRIQHVVGTTVGTGTTATLTITATTAGHLGCGFVCTGFNTPVPTVSDGTNSYAVVPASSPPGSTLVGQFLWGFYLANVAAGGTTLTFTQSQTGSGPAMSGMFLEYSGAATSGVLDGSLVGSGDTGTAAASGTTVTALGSNGDLVIAGCFSAQNTTTTVTASGGLTTIQNATNASLGGQLAIADPTGPGTEPLTISTVTGAITPGFSWTTASGWIIAAMAFKPVVTSVQYNENLTLTSGSFQTVTRTVG